MSVSATCEAPHAHQGLRAVIWFNESEPHPQEDLSHFQLIWPCPFLYHWLLFGGQDPSLPSVMDGELFIPSPPKPHPPAGDRPASPGIVMLLG